MFLRICRKGVESEVIECVGFNSRYENVPKDVFKHTVDLGEGRFTSRYSGSLVSAEMVEFVLLHESQRGDGVLVMSNYVFPDAELESVEEVGVSEGLERVDNALRDRLAWELGPGFGDRFHALKKEEVVA